MLGAIKAKDAERARLEGSLVKSRADLNAAIGGLYVNPHPADGVATLDDGIPFLLMPVRIETRFVDTGNAREMWLRIYPDDIAIHTHEETLTDAEVKDGEKYWKALFVATKSAGADVEDKTKAAWSTLVVTRIHPGARRRWYCRPNPQLECRPRGNRRRGWSRLSGARLDQDERVVARRQGRT